MRKLLVEASRRMLGQDHWGALEFVERCRKNPGLVRSCLMESRLLGTICASTQIPSTSFRKDWNTRGWRKEDRALFLYKIGAI